MLNMRKAIHKEDFSFLNKWNLNPNKMNPGKGLEK
jgi:hypothetical protein